MFRAATARAARGLAARSRGPPRGRRSMPPAGVATRALSSVKAPTESATRSIAGRQHARVPREGSRGVHGSQPGRQPKQPAQPSPHAHIRGRGDLPRLLHLPTRRCVPDTSTLRPREDASRLVAQNSPPTPISYQAEAASSAVRMCKSKDALFQRAGISRLRTVMRAGLASLRRRGPGRRQRSLLALDPRRVLRLPAARTCAIHIAVAGSNPRGTCPMSRAHARETAKEVAREALEAMEELAAADAAGRRWRRDEE